MRWLKAFATRGADIISPPQFEAAGGLEDCAVMGAGAGGRLPRRTLDDVPKLVEPAYMPFASSTAESTPTPARPHRALGFASARSFFYKTVGVNFKVVLGSRP